jgi:hypothetical protein
MVVSVLVVALGSRQGHQLGPLLNWTLELEALPAVWDPKNADDARLGMDQVMENEVAAGLAVAELGAWAVISGV